MNDLRIALHGEMRMNELMKNDAERERERESRERERVCDLVE